MKASIGLTSGISLFKRPGAVSAVVALSLFMVSAVPFCDRFGVDDGILDSGGALGLVPDSVHWVVVLNVDETLRGDGPVDFEEYFGLQTLSRDWRDGFGILIDDVNALVLSDITILAGEFDFGWIRDTLHEDGLEHVDFRGYEVWRGAPTLALLEDDGHVIVGNSDRVKDALKSLSRSQMLVNDNANPLKQALSRVEIGWLVASSKQCKADVQGCDAVAFSADTGKDFSLELAFAFLFRSEGAAKSAVRDIDSIFEEIQDHVSSFDYEPKADGEFVVVKASVDEDDFFPFLEQLPLY